MKPSLKTHKSDLEVKDKRSYWSHKCIRNTLSHSDTPICKIWYAKVRTIRSKGAGYESAQTDRQTVIPIHSPDLNLQVVYNKHVQTSNEPTSKQFSYKQKW